MKLFHYYVVNKNTGKKIYANCRKAKADEFLANLADKENYFIGYKFVSI